MKQGTRFINAIGLEVEAHGGSTPAAPAPQGDARPDQAIPAGHLAHDIFGRLYDARVPVFMPTGTRLVWDRLSAEKRKGSRRAGVLRDVEELQRLADEIGHAWGPNEVGMPPQDWLDGHSPAPGGTVIQPGYGEATPPRLPTPPSGTAYVWRAEFDKGWYEGLS